MSPVEGRPRLRRAVLLSLSFAFALASAACAGTSDGTRGTEEAREPGDDASEAEALGVDRIESLTPRVVATRPHRTDAFTQGLLFHDGFLYESTGQQGESTLRKVDPETGDVLVHRDLPGTMFGEGLALVPPGAAGNDRARLVQLTWRSGLALVWDLESLERVGEHEYSGEGWGLTFDGTHLVMSDGSSWLTFREPSTFAEVRRQQVVMGERPLGRLNELEWADGAVWANVWGTSSVVRIDPSTGRVTAVADLSRLYGLLEPDEAAGIDVLNGIAVRPPRGGDGSPIEGEQERIFYATGKYWPRMFEVVFEEP